MHTTCVLQECWHKLGLLYTTLENVLMKFDRTFLSSDISSLHKTRGEEVRS
jgi:hypothetical protein